MYKTAKEVEPAMPFPDGSADKLPNTDSLGNCGDADRLGTAFPVDRPLIWRMVGNSEIEIAPKALNGRVARHPQLNPTTLITLPQKAEALRLDSCKTTAWIPKRPAC